MLHQSLRRTALLAALAAIALPAHAEFRSVRIQVLDRGQADGILIRTPNENWIVIDAGTSRRQADAMREVWGVDRVALAVVSHRHFDHQGGMDEVLRDLPVDRFLGITDDCPGRSSDDRVRDQITDDVEVLPLEPGPITIDGVTIRLLPMPERSECPHDENDNSVVIRLEFGEFSMLFTGDAEDAERDFLVEHHAELLEADVLKASHHGSDNGTSEAWLEAVDPDHVVISAGVNGTYRHPHAEAVADYQNATGGRVFCTNRHGTIRVYGYPDGRVRVTRQFRTAKSCVYDGTHY